MKTISPPAFAKKCYGPASRDTEAQRQQFFIAKYGQIREPDWPRRCTRLRSEASARQAQGTKKGYMHFPHRFEDEDRFGGRERREFARIRIPNSLSRRSVAKMELTH
jgi:hypothetical protein